MKSINVGPLKITFLASGVTREEAMEIVKGQDNHGRPCKTKGCKGIVTATKEKYCYDCWSRG